MVYNTSSHLKLCDRRTASRVVGNIMEMPETVPLQMRIYRVMSWQAGLSGRQWTEKLYILFTFAKRRPKERPMTTASEQNEKETTPAADAA